MSPLYLGLGVTLFLGIFAVASMLLGQSSRATLDRVQQVTRTATEPVRRTHNKDLLNEWIAGVALWTRSHLGLAQQGPLGERMVRAGYRGDKPTDLYTAARIVLPLASFVLALFIPVARIFWMMSLPAIFYLGPDILLEVLIRRRTASIRKSLPDVIDLLVICVDAGLGIDQSMLRVAQELNISHPAVHEELLQINREQRAGKARIEAWQDMAARVRLPEVDSFVNMLLQTERFGTPISRALSTFAASTRLKRTQKAEEIAAKTTIKIIFPLALFIFPSIFIVLLGPAAITLIRGFHGAF